MQIKFLKIQIIKKLKELYIILIEFLIYLLYKYDLKKKCLNEINHLMNLIIYNICIKKYVRIVLMNALKGIIIYNIWKEWKK